MTLEEFPEEQHELPVRSRALDHVAHRATHDDVLAAAAGASVEPRHFVVARPRAICSAAVVARIVAHSRFDRLRDTGRSLHDCASRFAKRYRMPACSASASKRLFQRLSTTVFHASTELTQPEPNSSTSTGRIPPATDGSDASASITAPYSVLRNFCYRRSSRTSQHRYERGRRASLYRPERLEAVAKVEGNIPRVGGLQIRRQFVAIASLKCVLHQRGAVTFALMRGIHADQRQVPMRLGWMVLRHLLENGGTRVASSCRGGTLHECIQSIPVGMDAGWKPQCGSSEVGRAVSSAAREGIASKCTNKHRHRREILVCARPHPSRDRIS